MHQFNPKGEYKVGQRRAKEFVAKKADGGKVRAIPFSLDKTADALRRLESAGIGNKKAASDFAASRIKSHGIDPLPITGTEAKYKHGGKV